MVPSVAIENVITTNKSKMSTWNETFFFITNIVLFVCLLYACAVRDLYTYNGHCKGANGTHNSITKGIWQACIRPHSEGGREFCYSVLQCNDAKNDEWVFNNAIEELTGHANGIRNFMTLVRIFILLSLLGAGISLTGRYFIHADRIKDSAKKTLLQTLCSVCSVLTTVFCWCWWCSLWLLIHTDARNIYKSTTKSWKDFGHDSWNSFGSCFYVGITSMVLVNGCGVIDMVLLVRKCSTKCRGGGGGRKGEAGEDGGCAGESGGQMDAMEIDIQGGSDDGLYNSDTEALIINM